MPLSLLMTVQPMQPSVGYNGLCLGVIRHQYRLCPLCPEFREPHSFGERHVGEYTAPSYKNAIAMAE